MMRSRREFVAGALLAGGAGLRALGGEAPAATGAPTTPEDDASFRIYPVGRIEKEGDASRVRIFDRYADALLGLDGWSHVNVFYWFDRNDTPQRRRILQVHPRGNRDNPLTGVFACRSPVRPNLIALTVCKIVSVEGAVVTVDAIDAFSGTPVLDLKPFIPPDAPRDGVKTPEWAGPRRQ